MGRVLILALLLACAHATARSGPPLDLELPLSGSRVARLDLVALRGRPVLLWWFATWCVPCQAELPQLERLAAAYRDHVAVFAVAVDPEGDRLVRPYRDALRVAVPVALATDEVRAGTSPVGHLDQVPLVLLLDAAGRELGRFGSVRDPALEEALRQQLGR